LKLSTTFSFGLLKTTFSKEEAFSASSLVKGNSGILSLRFSISFLEFILFSSKNIFASSFVKSVLPL